MASIVKRGKSFSVVYNTTVGGVKKQKWETYHNVEEARQRRELLELCQRQKKILKTENVENVEQLMAQYIRLYGLSRWSVSTYQVANGLIQNYIIPNMGTMRLCEISPLVVAELYRRLLKKPKVNSPYHKVNGESISVAILKNIHKILHSAFEQAALWEYIPRNPFQKAVLPQIRPQPLNILAPEQIDYFLKNCGDQTLTLAVHLAFSATLRKGELLALSWSDVDFSKKTIQINKTIKRVSKDAMNALDNRDVFFQFPQVLQKCKTVVALKHPKTNSSVRTIYLPETVMQLLSKYRKSQIEQGFQSNGTFPNLIFRYADGRPFQETTLTKYFNRNVQWLGLPQVTFHSLRHSSITYKLVLSEGNIKAVQGDSGHAQAQMITETYGHILDQNRRETSNRFEQRFYQK